MIDFRSLSDDELKQLRRGSDLHDRLGAKDELERRETEKRQLRGGGEWWTRTGVIVTFVIGVVTIAVTIAVSIYLPEIRRGLGLEKSPAMLEDAQPRTDASSQEATKEASSQNSELNQAQTRDAASKSANRLTPSAPNTAESSARTNPTDFKPDPIVIEPIPIGANGLSSADAEGLASEAQTTAASILNCLAEYPSPDGRVCFGAYGTNVAAVRDKLHNRGVELSALSEQVRQLEMTPSASGLRRSAEVLRAIADKIHSALQAPPAVVLKEIAQTPVVLEPIFLSKGDLSGYHAQFVATLAQRTAAGIASCLVEHTEVSGKYCTAAYGREIVSVRDELHNFGIEFAELNADVKGIETQPSAALLRGVADKVLEIARMGGNPSTPIPDTITVNLPASIHMRKGRLKALSRTAQLTSSKLEECVAQDRDVVLCLQETVFADRYESVTVQINLLRSELGKSGVQLDGLEDVAKRIESGPNKAELRYFAKMLDDLSKQLARLAQ
jgi:hypothetical protein